MTSEHERKLARALDAKRRKDPKRTAYMRAYLKDYYSKNRDQMRADSKRYYAAHRQALIARARQWEKANPDKKRLSRQRSAPKDRARTRQWVAANKERHATQKKEYYASHYPEFLLRNHLRRALQRKAAVNLAGIRSWVKAVKAKPECVCYYCQSVIPTSRIQFDHIVPLSKGGSHSVENLCVSCAPCNRQKWNKPIQAWVRIGQQIFSL